MLLTDDVDISCFLNFPYDDRGCVTYGRSCCHIKRRSRQKKGTESLSHSWISLDILERNLITKHWPFFASITSSTTSLRIENSSKPFSGVTKKLNKKISKFEFLICPFERQQFEIYR